LSLEFLSLSLVPASLKIRTTYVLGRCKNYLRCLCLPRKK
jgi:hypothetical protein